MLGGQQHAATLRRGYRTRSSRNAADLLQGADSRSGTISQAQEEFDNKLRAQRRERRRTRVEAAVERQRSEQIVCGWMTQTVNTLFWGQKDQAQWVVLNPGAGTLTLCDNAPADENESTDSQSLGDRRNSVSSFLSWSSTTSASDSVRRTTYQMRDLESVDKNEVNMNLFLSFTDAPCIVLLTAPSGEDFSRWAEALDKYEAHYEPAM